MNADRIWTEAKAEMNREFAAFAGVTFIESLPLQTQNLLRVAAVTGYRLALDAAADRLEAAGG